MKAIDVIRALCKGDSVAIRIWVFDEMFECCHSAEEWNESYAGATKELLDKKVDYMYIYDGKLVIDIGN